MVGALLGKVSWSTWILKPAGDLVLFLVVVVEGGGGVQWSQ